MRIQRRTQRRNFLRPCRSLRSEWRSDRSLRSEWKQTKKSPTCFRRRYIATGGLTGRYVASGSKPRRVLLVFVVKSQWKLRLRRNDKRFDEDSKENAKEDLSEALQVTTYRAVCVLGRYVATELCACSVATWRPSCVRARSLHGDRAVCVLGRYVATELCA
ncbi:hypothetical protein F2Q69_00036879 [Brassica cretica]|uniref:Uncharacterized protein n=1 Tax=Brassica cretica TaxID=69181 RepID=A0A8S9SAA6_BRACR|nr:hypothetical protein F2Q69_00036879 [Brassica cretica]